MSKMTERVHFRLLNPACCNTLLCWVNPRLPNYCPECGERCYPEIRGNVLVSDDAAALRVDYDTAATIRTLNKETLT